MSVKEIKNEIETLPLDERRQLTAFLVALRHRDFVEYRSLVAKKIDDQSPENWISLDEYDRRLVF
jgi:hypothetical protein